MNTCPINNHGKQKEFETSNRSIVKKLEMHGNFLTVMAVIEKICVLMDIETTAVIYVVIIWLNLLRF